MDYPNKFCKKPPAFDDLLLQSDSPLFDPRLLPASVLLLELDDVLGPSLPLDSPSSTNDLRHTGHVPWSSSQGTMQSLWNKCSQGSFRTLSPSL